MRNYIAEVANASVRFSILLDEIAYIAEREQVSLGVMFVELKHRSACIQGKFLGFVLVFALSVEAIANKNLMSVSEFGLDLSKLVSHMTVTAVIKGSSRSRC